MCTSGTVSNTRVVVDTWGTGGPDVHSCTCTVSLDTGSAPPTATTTVTVQEYPGVEPTTPCGSTYRITSTKSSSFTETGCTSIPATPVNDFGKEDTLTLTQYRTDVATSWQSGHCILISQDNLTYELIVTCSNDITGTFTTTTTTTPKPATTTSVSRTTTTTPTPTQPPTVTSTGNTAVESTTAGGQTGSGDKTDDIEIGIIAGAAGGGGLLLIIIIVVIVIIIRKKSPGNKHPFDPGNQNNGNTNGSLSDDIQIYATTSTNNRYPNDDGDTLTQNSLYVSAGPRDQDTNHIVAGTGDMYAQVQKSEKRSTVDATDTDKLELEEMPQGDVYAVVNKPKKANENEERDGNCPSRYKNPDGLVYAEVSVQDITSRPKSRVKSRPPPVSPKPKTDTENVMYAEVNTGV